jgi:hypothetical protein
VDDNELYEHPGSPMVGPAMKPGEGQFRPSGQRPGDGGRVTPRTNETAVVDSEPVGYDLPLANRLRGETPSMTTAASSTVPVTMRARSRWASSLCRRSLAPLR